MSALVLVSDHRPASSPVSMRAWLRAAAQAGSKVALPDRRWLFHAGAPPDRAYVLASGVLELTGASGATISYLQTGPALVGVEEILGRVPERLCGVRAAGEAVLYALERAQFLALLERESALNRAALQTVAIKACALARPAADSRVEVETRLAALLAAYSDVLGLRVAEGIHIRLRRSQRELAEALGVGGRSVNRVMSRWRQLGLYERHQGYLTITNPVALAALAGELHGTLVLGGGSGLGADCGAAG